MRLHLGRYELLEEMGRGATGVVYKARDPLLERIVALKAIDLADPRVEAASVQRAFEREAKFAGRLNHPNIVTIHDAGTSGHVAYLATEFLEGRTLRRILDSGPPLPPVAIQRISAQAADGLAYMHREGVLHCRLSASSIFVLDTGLVKITHFSDALPVARAPVSKSGSGAIAEICCPDRTVGTPLDERCDLFALGAVLYEMLTGTPPFEGAPREEMPQQSRANRLPPSRCNPDIPSAFDYVVAKALARDPDHRYATAREMASDIRRLALEEPSFASTSAAHAAAERIARPALHGISAPPVRVAPNAHEFVSAQLHEADVPTPGQRRRMAFFAVPAALMLLGGELALLSRSAPWRDNVAEQQPPGPANATRTATEEIEQLPTTAQSPIDAEQSARTVPRQQPSIADEQQPESETPAPSQTASGTDNETMAGVARRTARLRLAVSPWGEVYVDGRRRGVSPPLRELELAPGRYTIEIRNTRFPPRTRTIDITAASRLKIKHKFE